MGSITDTIERIRGLEAEKQSLLMEIEELKKSVDSKAKALDCEVSNLRYEIQSLRALITREAEAEDFVPVKKRKQTRAKSRRKSGARSTKLKSAKN